MLKCTPAPMKHLPSLLNSPFSAKTWDEKAARHQTLQQRMKAKLLQVLQVIACTMQLFLCSHKAFGLTARCGWLWVSMWDRSVVAFLIIHRNGINNLSFFFMLHRLVCMTATGVGAIHLWTSTTIAGWTSSVPMVRFASWLMPPWAKQTGTDVDLHVYKVLVHW